jgi:hypothetical protein
MPYPSYPFSSPLLADEEDALGLSLGGDDTADDPNTDPNTDPTTGGIALMSIDRPTTRSVHPSREWAMALMKAV